MSTSTKCMGIYYPPGNSFIGLTTGVCPLERSIVHKPIYIIKIVANK